jgi:ketosteroid isomerase-like protein
MTRGSDANVDVVRQIFVAFNRRDWETWESHHHPDVEWLNPPEFPEADPRQGVDSIRRFFADLIETGSEWNVEVDEVRSVDRDRVLMQGRSVGVGRGSGIPFDDPLFQLLDFEDGRVRRVETFRSVAEALEAAGRAE